jgi:arylformamidase
MSRLIDISLPLDSALLVWPGDPPIEIAPLLRMYRGDPANVSELRLGTHSGTHVDPPVHFIPGGAGIDQVALETLVGEALVADLNLAHGPIGPHELDALDVPDGVTRLLLRTANSQLWRSRPIPFPDEYAHLTSEAAAWVVDRGLRLIGTDFLSIEKRGAPGHPVHTILLERGVVIVEGLNLLDVTPGTYTFICLPLRVVNGDGGPARAMLIDPD